VSTSLSGIGSGPEAALFPGMLSILIGTGLPDGYGTPQAGPPTGTPMRTPQSVAVDGQGNVYVADSLSNVVLELSASQQQISIVAGNGLAGFNGDGGPATAAMLNGPTGVAVDALGNVLIADNGNNRVRLVSTATHLISTFAGGGTNPGTDTLGDGGPATAATLNGPTAVAVDGSQNVYISDSWNNVIRRVDPSGTITRVAGSVPGVAFTPGEDNLGDGGSATSALLSDPTGLAVDATGSTLYIADTGDNLVRRVDLTQNTISVCAGNVAYGGIFQGDGGPAVNAGLSAPNAVAVDAAGSLYVADTNNHAIRRVDGSTGLITTIAGTGREGYTSSGLANVALLEHPYGLAIDARGNLYIADYDNWVVQKVQVNGLSRVYPATTVGQISTDHPFFLANIGNSPLTLDVFAISSNFLDSRVGLPGECYGGTTIPAGGTCSATIAFAPAADGSLVGSVLFSDDSLNFAAVSQFINLTGVGVSAAQIQPNISSVIFPDQIVGTSSAAYTLILLNSGNLAAAVSSISISGPNAADFGESNRCPSSLVPGGTCTVSITFTPSFVGGESASLSITDSGVGSPQVVTLAGTGARPPAPVVSLSPTSLNFGNQNVGTTSTIQTITLSNLGSAALSIANISIPPDFSAANTCGTSVPAGSNCMISVSFQPSAAGMRGGLLTIKDNASGSPQSVSLSGNGAVVPAASVMPGVLIFSNQSLGSYSPAEFITLSNTGSGSLSILQVYTTGDFSETNNCGSSVPPGQQCSIAVSFSPTALGTRTGLLTIVDNSSLGTQQTVSLSGTGAGTPQAILSPMTITFPTQNVGSTSPPQELSILNAGSAPLSVFAISVIGDFAERNTCGATLAAGSSCTVFVTFTPSTTGPRGGAIVLSDNASGSPQSVTLFGTGSGVPQLWISQASITFPAIPLGSSSSAQIVWLSNTGSAPLLFKSITATGDFAEVNNCGTLNTGSQCILSVTFTPAGTGIRQGAVMIADNAPGSPHAIGLWGSGAGTAQFSVAPLSLVFPDQEVGTSSVVQTATISNTGTGPLLLESVTLSGVNASDFNETSNCGGQLNPGAQCSILVSFSPSAAGLRNASVSIADSAVGSPHVLNLAGTGTGTALLVMSVSNVVFDSEPLKQASTPQLIVLSNIGSILFDVASLAISGENSSDFTAASNCGSTVAPLSSCVVAVTFSPTDSGARTASLTISDGQSSGLAYSVALSGTGIAQ